MAVKTRKTVIGDQKLAAHYGVSTKTVYEWRQKGMPCRKFGSTWEYDISETDPWVTVAKKRANGGAADTDTANTATRIKIAREAEQLRLARAKANQAEREEEIARGNVLNRADYELHVAEAMELIQTQMMRVPMALTPMVPAKYRPQLKAEGEKKVRSILQQTAKKLSEGPEN